MNSTEKIIWILNRLGESPYEMGLTEFAEELGIGKSGVYKILNILVKEGFVSKNVNTKKYYLGPALYRLGNIYSQNSGLLDIAEPIMRTIYDITQQAVSIGIREGENNSLAYRIERPNVVGLHKKIGKMYPINAGAAGKLLTAYNDFNKIKQILKNRMLIKYTPNTIIDEQELIKEYEKIRKRGYAISNEEHTLGLFGISVPIRDKYGMVWACLCIAGSKDNFTEKNLNNWIQLLKNGGHEISYKLGFIKEEV